MPLAEKTRKAVVSYILRDVVPKTITPRPTPQIAWFRGQFDFIPDVDLKAHLGEAFYQARYIGRIREALSLKGAFNNAIVKFQIIQYASIFEAVIDCGLPRVPAHPSVKTLINPKAGKVRKRIKFEDRLDAAVAVDLVKSAQRDFIFQIYDNRNNVHLAKAAEECFQPNDKDSSNAFHSMGVFLRNARTWFSANP